MASTTNGSLKDIETIINQLSLLDKMTSSVVIQGIVCSFLGIAHGYKRFSRLQPHMDRGQRVTWFLFFHYYVQIELR
jgi:hypothetical protein